MLKNETPPDEFRFLKPGSDPAPALGVAVGGRSFWGLLADLRARPDPQNGIGMFWSPVIAAAVGVGVKKVIRGIGRLMQVRGRRARLVFEDARELLFGAGLLLYVFLNLKFT